ncbi:hypothetical protein DFH29DRAFT_57026 [Suillus ampliporus]|nr:hypothetical protein DFH29DRAFT_57026 [Suillus ampliporus]
MSHVMDAGALTPFLWGFEGEKARRVLQTVFWVHDSTLPVSVCVGLRLACGIFAWTLGGYYTHMGTQFSSRVDEIQEVVTGQQNMETANCCHWCRDYQRLSGLHWLHGSHAPTPEVVVSPEI